MDPVTGVSHHFVRDKKGNLLSKFELESEIPKFIDEELVELADKLPFYNDCQTPISDVAPDKGRSYSQLCLIADYLKNAGDLDVLRGIWLNVGSFMNHQSSFADFDWSSERITTMFHHFFICLLKEVGQHLLTTGQFALEFETFGRFKYNYLRFWKDDCLVKAFYVDSA